MKKILLIFLSIIVLFFIIWQLDARFNFTPNTTTNEKLVSADGVICQISYVDKEKIAPLFGYFNGQSIEVRKDLPPQVIRFVRSHELYHCGDKESDGWILREIRANLIPAVHDPIGFVYTAILSLSKERLSYYLDRFKKDQ